MATAEVAQNSQRAWWLRTVMVLHDPRSVFLALRDESDEAEDARSEPVTALIFLGGIAGVLLAPRFGRMRDDYALDYVDILLIVIVAGSIYGFFSYYVLGWTLSLGVKAVGFEARAKQCRHVFGYALSPLVLSLILLWPLRLALYGGDLFREGGSDASVMGQTLKWLCVACAAWSASLLVYGLKTTIRLDWLRAAGASLFAVGFLALVLGAWTLIGPHSSE